MLDLEDGKGVISTVSKILISYLDDLQDMQDVPDMPISANTSEASHSAHDLTAGGPAELPAERTGQALPSFSDDADRVKNMGRPFSLPPTTEVKPEPTSISVRQSMPANIKRLPESKVGNSTSLSQNFAHQSPACRGSFRASGADGKHR